MQAQFVHKSMVWTLTKDSISKIKIKVKMAAIYKIEGIIDDEEVLSL